jgi:hypothetical protein
MNLTIDFPVLMWRDQKWLCKNVRVAQMQLEMETNIIYLN